MTSTTPNIRNGIQQFTIDMRTTSYNKNYDDLLSNVFMHFHFHIKRISLGFSGMHLAKLKVSNGCLSLRRQKQTLSSPPSFEKIMYILLCTMKLEESDALVVENKNAQCQKGRIFRAKTWLYHNHFLKENRQR